VITESTGNRTTGSSGRVQRRIADTKYQGDREATINVSQCKRNFFTGCSSGVTCTAESIFGRDQRYGVFSECR